jgi:hypothetical protein
MLFFGSLAALITAIGNKQWPWAIGIGLVLPFAIPYVIANREVAAWPRSLILWGIGALLLAGVLAFLFVPAMVGR